MNIENVIENVYEITDDSFVCGITNPDTEENVEIKYGVIAEVFDSMDIDPYPEEYPFFVESTVHATPDCLTPKSLSEVTRGEEEGFNPMLMDVHFNGIGVSISDALNKVTISNENLEGIDYNKINNRYSFKTPEDAEKFINTVFPIKLQAISVMIGFIMDCPINKIGTTGWDCLTSEVFGTNLFSLTFNKMI